MEYTQNTEDRYLTPGEIQDILKISSSATYALLGDEIACYRIGRSLRIREDDFQGWLLGRRTPSRWVSSGQEINGQSDRDQDDDQNEERSSWRNLNELDAGDDTNG